MHDIIVLKCGGSTIEELSDRFFDNIVKLKKAGLKPIIVHGGGPAILDMLTQLNIETEFVDGLRKTTEEVIDVVEMVLTGTVNQAFTRRLNDAGINSVGLSGSDANLLVAEPIDLEKYGLVGKVTSVNDSLLRQLLDLDIIPVIAPIAIGACGARYNVNADTAAAAVANALQAKQLVFVTDVPGIMHEDELLESVTEEDIKQLISSGVIHGGMIPKVQAAMESLNKELKEVVIVDGKRSALASETQLVGTIIRKTIEVI